MRALITAGCRLLCLMALPLLLAHAVSNAQTNRVDTGLQLRMADSLAGDSTSGKRRNTQIPNASGAAVAANKVTSGIAASPPRSGKGPGKGSPFRGLSLRLTSGLRFDDNVLSSNRGEQRDVIVVTRPAIYLDARFGRHDLRLGYEADMERYLGVSSQNKLHHNFLASGDLDLSRRLKSRLESGLKFGTDAVGDIGSRDATGGVPDRWRSHRLAGEVTLGRRIARAQIGVGVELSGFRYLNNNQQPRDYDRRDLRVTGRYNLGPKYALISKLFAARLDYTDQASTLDSREYSALFGIEWEATAKTSGAVSIGVRHRDFDAASRPSNGGFAWDARVTWAPKTYSQFTLYSSRQVSEGGFGGGGAVTITDISGLRWRHGLSERTTFEANVERSLSGSSGPDDEYMSYGAGLRYRLNRWVDVFGDWSYRSRSSPVPGSGYDTGGVFLGVDVSLDHALGGK
ncbi:MAG: hypothetical protein ACI9DC_004043 [Gammaproteobacteria bacterium]